MKGIVACNKGDTVPIAAECFVDCFRDGDLCAMAGTPCEPGSPARELQQVSTIFRMVGVETTPLLEFIRGMQSRLTRQKNLPFRRSVKDAGSFGVLGA